MVEISEVLLRYEQAERLKDEFLAELNLACGRTEDPLAEEFHALGDKTPPSWYSKCALILHNLAHEQDSLTFIRIGELMRLGTQGFGKDEHVLKWAREYFAPLRQSHIRFTPPISTAERHLAICLLKHCFETPEQAGGRALETAPYPKSLQETEIESQANLGKSIRVLATVLGSLAFVFTKAVVVLPLVLVAWVMAYALIDQRALKAQKERLALKSGETPAE